jgi:hypothetical protein
MDLKNTVDPCQIKPVEIPQSRLVIMLIHQPKNNLGNFIFEATEFKLCMSLYYIRIANSRKVQK